MGHVMSSIQGGDSKKRATEELKFPFEDGDLVWCNVASKTTERGNSYYIRNIFAYRNKYSYGWRWDYFVTIKNDYGYTVKMNANKFRKRYHRISEKEMLELRVDQLENKIKKLEKLAGF
jgi:hypothetical protein